MVCWADNVDWKKVIGSLMGSNVSEEDKSDTIYELEDEMGHDYLKSLPLEEIERLLLQKIREKKEGKKNTKKKKKENEEYVEEEEPAQSFYI